MIEQIELGLARLCVLCLLAFASLAVAASAASASTEVVYNNFNTVPAEVNGHPNTDTYSAYINYFPFGGMIGINQSQRTLRSLSAEVDSFSCEVGEYQYENCYSPKAGKKFKLALTASLYRFTSGYEPESTPFATSTETFKIPYRPSTNVHCPATEEGKGYGPNCDVGGVLATIKFKHFTPAQSEVELPERIIVLITTPSRSEWETHPVNVGLETSYKAFEAGKFVEELPADGGTPEIGFDPAPSQAYVGGKLTKGWENSQPVLEVTAKG